MIWFLEKMTMEKKKKKLERPKIIPPMKKIINFFKNSILVFIQILINF